MSISDDVSAIEQEFDTDVMALFGPFQRETDDRVITNCRVRRRRKNAMLIIATLGGDPTVAYRIARCLQNAYDTVGENAAGRFDVVVDTICKSAGTLLCLGANRLMMSDDAHLGPIDIQLRKPDEVGERTSGLTPLQALDTLKTQSLLLFKNHFQQLRFDDDLLFSTKLAAEIATKLAVGLMGPVYSQIDPIRLAEVERAIRISSEYAERISRNLKKDGLARLLAGYPSHGFVIDRVEAREVFENVETIPDAVGRVLVPLRSFSQRYMESTNGPFFAYLSDEPVDEPTADASGDGTQHEQEQSQNDGAGDAGSGGGV